MIRILPAIIAVSSLWLASAVPLLAQETRRVVLVLVSTPTCACNDVEGFASAIAEVKDSLRARAARSGHAFSAVGVALTSDPAEGMDYLLRGVTTMKRVELGSWDEVSAGNGWHSEFAVQRIWSGQIPAGFPQLLVLERRYSTTEAGITYGPERVLRRLEGSAAIISWVASGATF